MGFTKKKREEIKAKYKGACGYCGFHETGMQCDHIIPQRNFMSDVLNGRAIPPFLTHLTKGDVDHIDNGMPACAICNKWKDTHDLEGFRAEIAAQVIRADKYSRNFRMAKRYGQISVQESPIVFYFETIN